jgi:hypothetical protein
MISSNKEINKGKTPNKETWEKNKRIEVKTRDNTLEGAKHTMRSPKRRNQVR